ncbi:hypothetical protein SAMN05660831_01155 [Thiohalospira halophila DSM 15071]|uniref:Uncharacterized protein n=1 Tax=Thiohalospira halophila DSM 15071 TaxID=1123397 RepID=A0A1I1QL40_9GAMM|nr:hypothetical protein [Thiohalospira halophila]SFD22826.1 hypothetical protein SAMN05660831_01155 [Thiohalospira halophila DSM 15071]
MADLSGETARIYTTAQPVLDGERTRTLREGVGETATGRPVRLVEVPREYQEGQINAYLSNMEAAYSPHDWKVERQFGNVFGGED